MASTTNKPQDVPTAVRMTRVLESIKRMSPSDKVDLFVNAGLLPESEAPEAVERLTNAEKNQRWPKARWSGPAKKAAKQPGG